MIHENNIIGDNMKKDALQYFERLDQFQSFYYSLDIYNNWKIKKGLLNDRGKLIDNKSYVLKLRDLFDDKDFFRKRVSIAEIVSWLDTMNLINRLIDVLRMNLDSTDFQKISIYTEYMIQMSKKMRVDYVLEYGDSLLLIEFRTVNNFEKIRPTWQKKFQELLIYKELMNYYLQHKKILLYGFIAMYEYDSNKPINKHIEYNQNQINYLAEYIKRYLLKNEI
jgi:hypothetical protein